MITSELPTSDNANFTNLAQQLKKRKTPIAVAIAEYIGSLLHSNPDHIHVFGDVSEGVKEKVADLTGKNSK